MMQIPEALWHDICVCAMLAIKHGSDEDVARARRVNVWLDNLPVAPGESYYTLDNTGAGNFADEAGIIACHAETGEWPESES